VAKHPVNQYSVTDSKIASSGRSASVQSRNFSPIHASNARGLDDRARPIVDGFVACKSAL
jgi:hypothetical protein